MELRNNKSSSSLDSPFTYSIGQWTRPTKFELTSTGLCSFNVNKDTDVLKKSPSTCRFHVPETPGIPTDTKSTLRTFPSSWPFIHPHFTCLFWSFGGTLPVYGPNRRYGSRDSPPCLQGLGVSRTSGSVVVNRIYKGLWKCEYLCLLYKVPPLSL